MKNKKGIAPKQDLKDARRKYKLEKLNPKIKQTVPEIQKQMLEDQEKEEDGEDEDEDEEDMDEDDEEDEEEEEVVKFHGKGIMDDEDEDEDDDEDDEGDEDDDDDDDDDDDEDDDDDDDDEDEEDETLNEQREATRKILAERRANLGPSEAVRKRLRMKRNQKKLKEKEKHKKKINDKKMQKVGGVSPPPLLSFWPPFCFSPVPPLNIRVVFPSSKDRGQTEPETRSRRTACRPARSSCTRTMAPSSRRSSSPRQLW